MESEKEIILTIVLCLLLSSSFGQTVNDLRPTVTMKEYVDMNIEWSQKYSTAQLAALEKANELVRLSLQEYKTVNNEWREQLKASNSTYVSWQALIGLVIGLSGLFWGYSRNQREKQAAERNIQSGDEV